MAIRGDVAARFEPVRAAFAAHAKEMGKGGAAFAVYRGDEKIVDLWGGFSRPEEEWTSETVSVFYSASKVAAGIVAMIAHDRGQLEFDVPVARYWPEFAANGKERITVRQVLAMQSGLPWIPNFEGFLLPEGPGWDDFESIEHRLAASAPQTAVGQPCYGPVTFGFLVNAIVRRATGRELKDVWNADVAAPLGLDLFLGGPPSTLARMATLYNAELSIPLPPGSVMANSFHAAQGQESIFDRLAEYGANPAHLRGGVASSDMVGTAESMARVYAMLVNGGSFNGVSVLSPEAVAAFTTVQSTEPDTAWAEVGDTGPSSWMLGGIEGNRWFFLVQGLLYGSSPQSYGKVGAGGQYGFADPERRLAVAFLRSHLTLTSPLYPHLVEALYSCL